MSPVPEYLSVSVTVPRPLGPAGIAQIPISRNGSSWEQWFAFHLTPAQQALIGLLLPVAVAGIGLLLVRKFVRQDFLRQHHEISGPVLNALGTVYGVFMALVASTTWGYYEQTSANIVQEARDIQTVYANATAFPEPFRSEIRQLWAEYRDVIVTKEWPDLARGEALREGGGPRIEPVLRRISDAYAGHQISTPAEGAFFSESVTRLDEIKSLRASRFDDAVSSLPGIIWLVLVVGAFILVTFCYLFGARSYPIHTVMTLMLTAMIALICYTTLILDFPFVGPAAIGPEAFTTLDLHCGTEYDPC